MKHMLSVFAFALPVGLSSAASLPIEVELDQSRVQTETFDDARIRAAELTQATKLWREIFQAGQQYGADAARYYLQRHLEIKPAWLYRDYLQVHVIQEEYFFKRTMDDCASARGSMCKPALPTPHQAARDIPACTSTGNVLEWLDASNLSGAPKAIAEFERQAATRELFACEKDECLLVISMGDSLAESPSNETLAACKVEFVHDTVGPPFGCVALVKRRGNVTLIHAIIGRDNLQCAAGFPDFEISLDDPRKETQAVVALVKEVLSEDPFNLDVSQQGDAIYGTRMFLPSKILPSWREWVTVRVDLSRVRGPAESLQHSETITLNVSTTILVSRQNSTERESWTAPSEQQESTYVARLKSALIGRGGKVERIYRRH